MEVEGRLSMAARHEVTGSMPRHADAPKNGKSVILGQVRAHWLEPGSCPPAVAGQTSAAQGPGSGYGRRKIRRCKCSYDARIVLGSLKDLTVRCHGIAEPILSFGAYLKTRTEDRRLQNCQG